MPSSQLTSIIKCICDHVLDGLPHAVGIDALKETVARMEHFVEVVDFFVMVANLVVNDTTVQQEALRVIGAAQAQIERITLDIIVFVDIHTVLFVGHHVKQKSSFG